MYRDERNRRYSISSTRSSVLSTTLSTSVNFSKRSVSPTLSREQSVPLALRTPKRFSTNASATRSTRPKPTSRTTNVTMTTRKAGSSTTSIRTAGLSSASLIRHIHSRGTTLNGCTPSMIRTSPDRWFVTTNQRSASTRSTASVVSFPRIRRKNASATVSNGSASRIPLRGFCSSWIISPHICEYTRRRAHQLGIDLVFLPLGRRI